MYQYRKPDKSSIRCEESTDGETIEQKMRRVTENQEPITDGAPLIFTERDEGVDPATNVRTDRFDIAVDAMDRVNKSKITKRQELLKEKQIIEKGDTETQINQETKK